MPNLTFIHPDGRKDVVDAKSGLSVMEVAIAIGIDGIVAECGGNMMCATCHVYVEGDWPEHLPPMQEVEDQMLGETACERLENSRLSCQIKMNDALDGLAVRLPSAQV